MTESLPASRLLFESCTMPAEVSALADSAASSAGHLNPLSGKMSLAVSGEMFSKPHCRQARRGLFMARIILAGLSVLDSVAWCFWVQVSSLPNGSPVGDKVTGRTGLLTVSVW